MLKRSSKTVVFDGTPLTIGQVKSLADGVATPRLCNSDAFRLRIDRGADFLSQILQEDGVIYGVTTGYGDSCGTSVPAELVYELPQHLYTFHGCGMGDPFTLQESRAILIARLASLCRGYSGVRYKLLERICLLLKQSIIPVIPQEGSVGASGDLTPLSYLAAVIEGHRNVWHEGEEKRAASDAYAQAGVEPLILQPKEALAIMNGTAVMTGVACLSVMRAHYIAKLAARVTSFFAVALGANNFHFDLQLFSVKAHPGLQQVAQWIHEDLKTEEVPRNSSRLQDQYSLRCAPHVIGVLQDELPTITSFVEHELNSANDNPIIDAENAQIFHGGHFYGGHISHAMDCLKISLANIADLIDRQIALAVDPKFNRGLPANLSGAAGNRAAINHGFKAVQIAASAWAAEALKGTMPASVFSRSTECHNQDKVSMGTIAARDCTRILQLVEQVLAAGLAVSVQGIQLRLRSGQIALEDMRPELKECFLHTCEVFDFLEEDRPLESDLRRLVDLIRQTYWVLYE